MYFHSLPGTGKSGKGRFKYSIIDGKQRLESIWEFIENRIPLADDFKYLNDSAIEAAGLNYRELGRKYPTLKMRFDGYPLSIISVETDDTEMIEEMFSRLNEAVPLSAAERRNAFGGPIPRAIRRVSKHRFFTTNTPYSNSRYRHFDLAAKFLQVESENRITDTKKAYLDQFVKTWKNRPKSDAKRLEERVTSNLDNMSEIFVDGDQLLRSAGSAVIFYHLWRIVWMHDWSDEVSRSDLLGFEHKREINRTIASESITDADYDLLEFDRLVQSPNDAYATEFRLRTLLDVAFNKQLPDGYGRSR